MDYEKEIQKALLHLKINPGLFSEKNMVFEIGTIFLFSKSVNSWLNWAISGEIDDFRVEIDDFRVKIV